MIIILLNIFISICSILHEDIPIKKFPSYEEIEMSEQEKIRKYQEMKSKDTTSIKRGGAIEEEAKASWNAFLKRGKSRSTGNLTDLLESETKGRWDTFITRAKSPSKK